MKEDCCCQHTDLTKEANSTLNQEQRYVCIILICYLLRDKAEHLNEKEFLKKVYQLANKSRNFITFYESRTLFENNAVFKFIYFLEALQILFLNLSFQKFIFHSGGYRQFNRQKQKKIIDTSKRTFIKWQLLVTALPMLFITNMAEWHFVISYLTV